MEEISTDFFIKTVENEGAVVKFKDNINEIEIFHITGKNNKTIVFLAHYELLDPHYAAQCLEQLGMLDLLPFIIPDHPAAQSASKLASQGK